MFLFGQTQECSLCGETVKCKKIHNGWICEDCKKRIGVFDKNLHLSELNVEDVRKVIELNNKNKEKIKNFTTTKKIGRVEIDDEKKQWLVADFCDREKLRVFDYTDINSVDVVEDMESIYKGKQKGSLASVVAGGVLIGGAGAVAGGIIGPKKVKGETKNAVNSLEVKIMLNDKYTPYLGIPLISAPTKVGSFAYAAAKGLANEMVSLFLYMQNDCEKSTKNKPSSLSEELLKLKELHDSKIITDEEFEKAKNKLLD